MSSSEHSSIFEKNSNTDILRHLHGFRPLLGIKPAPPPRLAHEGETMPSTVSARGRSWSSLQSKLESLCRCTLCPVELGQSESGGKIKWIFSGEKPIGQYELRECFEVRYNKWAIVSRAPRILGRVVIANYQTPKRARLSEYELVYGPC